MKLIWPERFCFVGKSYPEGREISAGSLAAYASDIADMLRARGVRRGDRVALWLSEGPDQIAAMFGCWAAEVTFCVLPSFAGRSNTERSQQRVDNVLSVLQPKLLLTTAGADLPDALSGAVETVPLPGVQPDAEYNGDPNSLLPEPAPGDIAFIQFTSGSTGGNAKGAAVGFDRLESNLDAIARRTGLNEQDRMVSWAPLYHDMGLMAVLLPLRRGADLVLMETDHFVRRSTAWLETISRFRGTISTAPPTALKLLSKRRASNIDLSSWRYAWIGGEMVFPKVLADFEEAYAPSGLQPNVLQPTYGMAETVVGISCGAPGEARAVRNGAISCGQPLDCMELRIADEDGAPLGTGEIGRIMVKSPSVITGYLGMDPFPAGDWFDTGDLGFQRNDRVFVTGRIKDILKRGAESFPATLVEAIAEEALALRTGRAAAFANLREDLGKEEIVLLVESRDWNDQQARTVATAIASELGLQVDIIRNATGGRLPRTSSGKIMRQKAAALYKEGSL